MQHADTVIDARWVVTVDPSNSVLERHSVVISGNKIQDILPSGDIERHYIAARHLRRTHHAIIPGFINAHTHAAMSLFRGAAEDKPLFSWLNDVVWPLEKKWVDDEFVRDGTKLAIAEMIQSGTTCMNDMYLYPESAGIVAEQLHMRTCLGMIVLDFPTSWAKSADEYLAKGQALFERFESSDMVSTMLAPHAPYTVSDKTIGKVLQLAADKDLGVHMHVHETEQEVESAVQETGIRPIERLQRLGAINSKFIAVHATALNEEEISLLSESDSNVAHCPKSNLKLASGFCPTVELLKNHVNVGIGTDGAASNNSLNMLEELRFAALLAKGFSGDASEVPVHEALRLATINGAKCLGLDAVTGSLEPGKFADLSTIDLSEVHCRPLYDPVAQIVHSASRSQITDVFVGGRPVLQDRKLLTVDEEECIETADRWRQSHRS